MVEKILSKYIKCFESRVDSTGAHMYMMILKENIEDLIEYGINHKPIYLGRLKDKINFIIVLSLCPHFSHNSF